MMRKINYSLIGNKIKIDILITTKYLLRSISKKNNYHRVEAEKIGTQQPVVLRSRCSSNLWGVVQGLIFGASAPLDHALALPVP